MVKKLNESSDKKQRLVFYLVLCKTPFVVSSEKAEEFTKQHTSHSDSCFVKRLAKVFRKNNLMEEGPGLY